MVLYTKQKVKYFWVHPTTLKIGVIDRSLVIDYSMLFQKKNGVTVEEEQKEVKKQLIKRRVGIYKVTGLEFERKKENFISDVTNRAIEE